jgi:glycosyltransferase involved in cell wall biosynthesis
MSIYVDISSAVHAKAGLKRYAENLVRELRPLLGQRLRLFQNSQGRRGPLPGWEDWPTMGVRWGYKPWRLAVWMAQEVRWPMDHLLPDAELFHATEHLLPYLRHTPAVLTVHDLIYERFPDYHKRLNHTFLHAAMPLFCKRATAIIAISSATRGDLVSYYGIDVSKIAVIPEAAAAHFCPQEPRQVAAVRRRYNLPERYLLTVGTIEPRKNLASLVDACGPLFAEALVDGLVIVGSKGWLYEGFFAHLEHSPWRNRIILPGFVADEDLPSMYAGAAVTVQPSLYEGFGLPVLEAMACGSPVCASGVSSLPEVGGQAAHYFDPQSTDEIYASLRQVLGDQEMREAMRQQGLAQSALFSWQHTAEETLWIYEQVVAGQPICPTGV